MRGFEQVTINEAMVHISNNDYVLPAFQREFVWKAEQIENLFDSLMRSYPIGSMLFWKVMGETKTNWNFYEFINNYISGARDKWIKNELFNSKFSNDFYAILDGQQRLTAIRIGLSGTYSYHEKNKSWDYSLSSFPKRRLYLCLSKTGGENDDFKYIFKFKKDSETGEKELYKDTNEDTWFKVSHITTLGCDYNKFIRKNIDDDEWEAIIDRLYDVIYKEPIIPYYKEEEQDPDKAVDIFTRINSGGTNLEFSDIVYSLMVANWEHDARTEISELIKGVSEKGFDINKDYIIKAFLYLYHSSIKTSINSFTKDFCKKIENNWGKIHDCILSLFDLLRSFGLSSFTLTSNNATLPILYYLYHNNIYENYKDIIEFKAERGIIKKWLLSMLIRRVFGSQSDNKLTQTRKAFTNDIKQEFLTVRKEFPASKLSSNLKGYNAIDDDFLKEILKTQKDDKYAFSILALLYPNLDYKNNNFHKDHIHAENLYKNLSDELKEKYTFADYNSIVNLQMLDANENESKSNMSLESWINKETTAENKEAFLKTHIIPNIDLSLSNLDEYMVKRKEMLMEKLRELLV